MESKVHIQVDIYFFCLSFLIFVLPFPDPLPAAVRRPCHGFGPRDRAGQASRAANHWFGFGWLAWHA
jgi:hypothetical protein